MLKILEIYDKKLVRENPSNSKINIYGITFAKCLLYKSGRINNSNSTIKLVVGGKKFLTDFLTDF